MKKILFAAFCILLISLIAACSGGENEMTNTETGYIYIAPPADGGDCAEYVGRQITADCKKVILGAGTFSVDGDLVIDCDVEISAGTKINVSESGSLTVNGDFFAGKRKIFSGGGKIRLNMPETSGYVDWFLNTVSENPNDHTALLQKAFDSMSRFFITDEGYKISEITIAKPVSVTGLGTHRVPINAKTGVNTLFTVRSSDVSFQNLLIRMASANENNICFFFDTSADSYENFSAKDVYIDSAYASFKDADGEGTYGNVFLSGITMQTSKDTQLVTHNVNGLTLIDFAVLRRHGAGISCNMPGVIIENADGVRMEHLDVNGDWTDTGTDGHGIVMRNCRNVTMRKILMEYICGTGFIFENCSGFDLENIQTYTFKNVGLYIDGLKDSTIRIVKMTNGNSVGQDDDASKKENYIIRNCENVVFDSVISNFANNTGIVIGGCRNMTINGFMYSDVRNNLDAFVLLDEGGNENVVINGFTDKSSVSKRKGKSYSLTGNGITIKSALLAMSKYYEIITEGGQG